MAAQESTGLKSRGRHLSLALLAGGLLLLLLGMSAFNAFRLAPPHHNDPTAVLLFTCITVVLFLLLLLLVVLLARNILKMYGDGRSRVLGSRLRSRMLLGALLLSFAPAVFMALFSFLLMNRSLDRWFSQPVSRLRDQSFQVALELSHYVSGNARAEAESMARSPEFLHGYSAGDLTELTEEMRKHRITLEGGWAFVYRDGRPVAGYQVPPAPPLPRVHTLPEFQVSTGDEAQPSAMEPSRVGRERGARAQPAAPVAPFTGAQTALATAALRGATNSDAPMLLLGPGNAFALGSASLADGGIVVVALPMPIDFDATLQSITNGAREYWAVYQQRRTLRFTFLLLLGLLTVLTFFASSWLALFLSKQITRPVEALADAMDAIAAGDYGQRIDSSATEELSELIASFNQMATDLEESRTIADGSAAQIAQANRTLTERQHELELILETIPSGVVVLDAGRTVLQVNRAFLDLLPAARAAEKEQAPLRLETLLPPAILEEVLRLDRRAQRMGIAGVELELPAREPGGPALSLSVSIAVLNLGRDTAGHDRRGSVLVVDDVSEVLQAQRQVAWKEVAQRVAHEIKNPLTPISLSAERILRHVDRSTPESLAIIRRCSEVILSSVESMRVLVDQFGTLAQFPAAQPAPASLNEIAASALLLFGGRLEGVRVETSYLPHMPPVLADAEALKRALANLIENAAEAMRDSLHRVLRVETGLSERSGMAEVLVSDTGPGLSAEVRERLFLPYFSTKQRGTGLGLAIVAKIAQDHHGAVRAEQRGSSGACFILEVPLARAAQPSAHEPVTA